MDMEAIIALLVVLGTLTACAGETVLDVKNALPMAAAPQAITYTAETKTYADTIADEDGVPLVSYSYDVPVLTAWRSDGTAVEEARTPEEETALAAVETFNSRYEAWTEEERIEELVGYAQQDRQWRTESGQEWNETSAYTETLACTIYQTEHLVSVSASYDSYTGGAHPNQMLLAWNFDLSTGDFFSVETLAADSQAFSKAVGEEIVRQAEQRAAEEGMDAGTMLWSDYREIAADWSSYAVSFHEDGMTIGYSPYEIACYAAGAQVYHLDYEQLLPMLSDHGKSVLELESQE